MAKRSNTCSILRSVKLLKLNDLLKEIKFNYSFEQTAKDYL